MTKIDPLPAHDAPQVELGPCALHDHFGAGECPDCEVRRKLAEAESRIAKLEAEKQQLEAENRVNEQLLEQRQRVLNAVPECPVHGSCVPHAVEWIEAAKSAESQLHTLRDAVRDKVDKLEGYGFECIAGPLEKATDWHDLRALVTPQGEK